MTDDVTTRPDLRVMSANVRIPVDDGDAAWTARRGLLADVIRDADPDVIGTQELTSGPASDLLAARPDLRMLGRDRFGGHDDEHGAILYRADRIELLGDGDFWLSDTPDAVASITWGTLYPRTVTWARFRHRPSGREFVHANTHFPFRPHEDARARELSAALIAQRLPAIAPGLPVVLTGDFNTDPHTRTHQLLTAVVVDVHDAAPHAGPDGTFHGFTGRPGARIDWILAGGFAPKGSATITTHDGGVYPSDHFPVTVDLAWI